MSGECSQEKAAFISILNGWFGSGDARLHPLQIDALARELCRAIEHVPRQPDEQTHRYDFVVPQYVQ
jgi:hypothetical protein